MANPTAMSAFVGLCRLLSTFLLIASAAVGGGKFRHSPELGLQFDGAGGGGEVVVLDGAAIDDFELAEKHVHVAAVAGGEVRLDFPDAGADAVRPQQPIALFPRPLARVAGFRRGGGGGGVKDEGLAEPFLPEGQRGWRGSLCWNLGAHDLMPYGYHKRE